MKKNLFNYLILAVIVSFMASCNDESEESSAEDNGFDRSEMLANYADKLIIPSYADLEAKLATLKTAATAFNSDVNQTLLDDAQAAWVSAYQSWQFANAYNFGPAGASGVESDLVEEIGTFPINTATIDNRIQTGNYNLGDFARDARGFLAVEYLLFDIDNGDASVITAFGDANRKQYLIDLVDNISTKVTAVRSEWESGYRDEFIGNNGTDAGSSTSAIYNNFVRSFEALKNFKLGLPLGLRAGQTQAEPDQVEARYSGQSYDMLKLNFEAVESIWRGLDQNGNDGIGFREYLQNVEGGPELISSTEAQLTTIKNAMDAVSTTSTLRELVADGDANTVALHTALQQHTRFFKSDMSSVLGITITFSSGDGD